MEFKELELKAGDQSLERKLRRAHIKKSIIATVIGAAAGFLFFYFSEGRQMASIPGGEVLKSLAIGAFFGLFLTNSPCARGRC